MCVDKEKWEKFQKEMREDVRVLMHDVKGIRTSQQALGELSKQTEQHLKKLNSRTSKVEDKVGNLEDADFREVRCIQRDNIGIIKDSMLTVEKFEEWEKKKLIEKEKEQARRMHDELIAIKEVEANQRRLQWIISAIVGTGTVVVALITYLA